MNREMERKWKHWRVKESESQKVTFKWMEGERKNKQRTKNTCETDMRNWKIYTNSHIYVCSMSIGAIGANWLMNSVLLLSLRSCCHPRSLFAYFGKDWAALSYSFAKIPFIWNAIKACKERVNKNPIKCHVHVLALQEQILRLLDYVWMGCCETSALERTQPDSVGSYYLVIDLQGALHPQCRSERRHCNACERQHGGLNVSHTAPLLSPDR